MMIRFKKMVSRTKGHFWKVVVSKEIYFWLKSV